MDIKDVIIRTSYRYVEHSDNYRDTPIDTLELEIPLPGGTAKYTIDLPKGMKENLEFAAQLSTKR